MPIILDVFFAVFKLGVSCLFFAQWSISKVLMRIKPPVPRSTSQPVVTTPCTIDVTTPSALDLSPPPSSETFVMVRPGPGFFTHTRRERHRILLEQTKALFPNGIPEPQIYMAFRNVPVVRATILVSSDDQLHTQMLENVSCVWSTGARMSYILTGRLAENVRGDQEFQTTFCYLEHLPNNCNLVILGINFIECFEMATIPKIFDPPHLANTVGRYGTFQMLQYCDPVDSTITRLTQTNSISFFLMTFSFACVPCH